MTIHAVFPAPPVQAADTVGGSRTITGLAVPWGQPGRVSDGTVVVFHQGSIDAAGRPVALRDHDRTRPIGRVTDAADTGQGLAATITVSRTRDGDDALVLAGDGALPALSVGVEPTDYAYDADGALHVHGGDWLELSLLTLGAFSDARVANVTAAPPGGTMPATITDTDAPDAPDAPVEPDDGDPVEPEAPPAEPVETEATTVPITAGRSSRQPARAHPYASVGIARLSHLITAAYASGDLTQLHRITTSPGARPTGSIEAAFTDVTLVGTDNVGSAYRPGYQAELVEIVSHGTPAVDSCRPGDLERGDYPNKTFNAWTKTPQVALQAAEKDEINSTPVAIGPTSVPVQTWATGNDLSQQLLDFGAPSFVEDYIRAAGVDYAEVIDTYAVTAQLAAATDVPTVATDDLVDIIGKLFGGLNVTKVPGGGMVLLVSWDLGVGAIGLKGSEKDPVFWDGSINFGSFIPSATMGGLTVQVDANMPARTALLKHRNAATWYDLPGTPFSLRAINVGQLGLDIAVYGYGALGVQFPLAMTKTTVPVAGP